MGWRSELWQEEKRLALENTEDLDHTGEYDNFSHYTLYLIILLSAGENENLQDATTDFFLRFFKDSVQ